MPHVIKLKNSTEAGKVPVAGDLATAELAINLADKKLYSKDASGTVFELGGGGSRQVKSLVAALVIALLILSLANCFLILT